MGLNKKEILAKLAIKLGPVFLRLLGKTYRLSILEPDYSKPDTSNRIYVFWHGKMILPLLIHQGEQARVMISEHRDGEIIARIVEALGLQSVRGSSTRGGKKAYTGMLSELKNGFTGAITPDGPQGPRHKMKTGAIRLSADSGVDIYLISCWSESKWQFNSWDGFEFPKPFTKAVVAYKVIPAISVEEDIEVVAMNLEKELDNLEKRCRDALR